MSTSTEVSRPPGSHHTQPSFATNLRLCPSDQELLEATFGNPSNGFSSYGEDEGLILVAIWCLVSQGDMQLWPWWCDAARGRSCPGVALAAEYVKGAPRCALPRADTLWGARAAQARDRPRSEWSARGAAGIFEAYSPF